MKSSIPSFASNSSLHSVKRSKSGFSLVEVTLALGLVAFTVTSLLGVLPLALNTYKSTMDSSLRTHILRTIASELDQAPFDTITSSSLPNAPFRYFNDQGLELVEASDIAAHAAFKVCFKAVGTQTSAFGMSNPSLRPVTLEIWNALGQPSKPEQTVTLFIPDNGLRSSPTALAAASSPQG